MLRKYYKIFKYGLDLEFANFKSRTNFQKNIYLVKKAKICFLGFFHLIILKPQTFQTYY